MPFTRQNAHLGNNQENQTRFGGKAEKFRAALTNISNKAPSNARGLGKKAKQEISKPHPNKSKVTSRLKDTEKENAHVLQVQQKETSPDVHMQNVVEENETTAPMDISTNEPPQQPMPLVDIDEATQDDPVFVSQYANEIYDYLHTMERKFSIRKDHLEGKDANARARGILINWLVQVQQKFNLLNDTLHLTVAIIDRVLQIINIPKKKLQLLGVGAMFLATKYEEMHVPEILDFVYITDNSFSASQIRQMEVLILKKLEFNIGMPTAPLFLRRLLKATRIDGRTYTLIKYLTDLSLMDYSMACINPSQIAAASFCLAMKIYGISNWNSTVIHYSKYTETDLKPTMSKIANLIQNARIGRNTAVYQKYASSVYLRISTAPELRSPVVHQLAMEEEDDDLYTHNFTEEFY